MSAETPSLPPTGRTLVMCFDGTSKKYGEKVTNVIRLFRSLERNKHDQQICYYQPGIGTYVAPTKPFASLLSGLSMVIDKAVAWHLDAHVTGGYEWLMENYVDGDRICLFGFSRGAYIARCLAGMLHMVGLLPKGNSEQVPFAYSVYRNDSLKGVKSGHGFKHAFSRPVRVKFLGVWDSVSSVGLGGRTLPLTSLNGMVEYFRQALALDERRAKFRHSPWMDTSHFIGPRAEPKKPRNPVTRLLTNTRPVDHPLRWSAKKVAQKSKPDRKSSTMSAVAQTTSATHKVQNDSHVDGLDLLSCDLCPEEFTKFGTNCREVWFSGSHCDVGGDVPQIYPVNLRKRPDENSPSNPSLLWMVQQIEEAGVGIKWCKNAFYHSESIKAYLKLSQRTASKLASEKPEATQLPEDVLNALSKDAMTPLQDKLSRPWSVWWLLECIPLSEHYLTAADEEWKRLSVNVGRGRRIHHEQPLFHVSVKMREDASKGTYKPRARGGSPSYVHS